MKFLSLLIIVIFLLAVFAAGWWAWREYGTRGVMISTDKKEYAQGDNPKIRIQNKKEEAVCFSSCYPYYLEKINGAALAYNYGACPFSDAVGICLKKGEVKSFELFLNNMQVEKGKHRVAVPVCGNCSPDETFRKDKFFYSNEFIIK